MSVDRQLAHSRELEFPAVTICNTNPVKQSNLYLVPELNNLINKNNNNPLGEKKRRKKRDCMFIKLSELLASYRLVNHKLITLIKYITHNT